MHVWEEMTRWASYTSTSGCPHEAASSLGSAMWTRHPAGRIIAVEKSKAASIDGVPAVIPQG